MATKSKIGTLNYHDILKGLLIAVSSAALMTAQQMLTSIPPKLDIKEIGIVALVSAIAYIGKQLSTNSDGDLLKKEN